MEGYQLVEYNDDDRTFNIIFSQPFGGGPLNPYEDERAFLSD